MNNKIIVTIRNTSVGILVTGYAPAIVARTSGSYDDCDPADPGYVEWEANTGSTLLNYYIDNESAVIRDMIENQLIQILEARNE